MPLREPGSSSSGLHGPALFLSDHPAAYWLSLLAASAALALFIRRAVTSHGRQRWLWFALSGEQLVQVIGIATLRSRAYRRAHPAEVEICDYHRG
jgi:hypothetical protein